ncbi:MAG: CoA transferase [Betaproteobacteria bacterium]|nr:CoA transferase [Betaproteobacteria bacterium]
MKLSGVRVVDLSLFLPGPHLTGIMADHGADVIKVEPYPHGEPARHAPYVQAGHTVWFRNIARGKQSIRLNLKDPRGKEILFKLCERADVFVESFRPGVMKRLGIDYAVIAARAPQIIYCSISAFGQTGQYSTKPAHDPAIQAMAGVASVTRGRDGYPAMPGVAAADMTGSLMALSGVLMALVSQRATGKGDYLDIAMMDSLMACMPHVLGPVFLENRAPIPQHERSWGGGAFNNPYETKDGQFLMMGGLEVHFAKNVLTKAGRPDLVALCEQPSGPVQDPVKAFLCGFFKTKALAEWEAWFADVDAGWAPIRDLHQAFFDPATAVRGMLLRDSEGVPHVGVPIKFSNDPARPNFHVPKLGEHAQEILRRIGYTDTEIDLLEKENVL